MPLLAAAVLFALATYGCASYRIGPRYRITTTQQSEETITTLNTIRKASPGDTIFTRSTFTRVPALAMSAPVKSSMPGMMSLPFTFAIDQCTLVGAFSTDSHDYFAAPPGKSRASHSILGNVLGSGDTVGVRVNKQTGEKEWYVDNSQYNGQVTVWHRRVRESDKVEFERSDAQFGGTLLSYTDITFDGYHSGLLHFKLRRMSEGRVTEDTFRFDFLDGEPTRVSILGHHFDVVSANSSGITYRRAERESGDPGRTHDLWSSSVVEERIDTIGMEISLASGLAVIESEDPAGAVEYALARVEPLLIDLKLALEESANASTAQSTALVSELRRTVRDEISRTIEEERLYRLERERSLIERFGPHGGSTIKLDRILRRWHLRQAFEKPAQTSSEELYAAWSYSLGARCAELRATGLSSDSETIDRAVIDCNGDEQLLREALRLEGWQDVERELLIRIAKSDLLSALRGSR